ncbi:hypothetical protein BZG36_02235 [Bifiguratus adelaidae]|uniref:ABC transporter domain-containing protein n=1 Tax=Bifiguratus adelaidae TaxID=1938954 RepID=A0A261Y1P4_9FUNG|nr:hypothetical protein BZG36_02235 [Bifiguratus adelaidae]
MSSDVELRQRRPTKTQASQNGSNNSKSSVDRPNPKRRKSKPSQLAETIRRQVLKLENIIVAPAQILLRLMSEITSVPGAYTSVTILLLYNIFCTVQPAIDAYLNKSILDSIVSSSGDPHHIDDVFYFVSIKVAFDVFDSLAHHRVMKVKQAFSHQASMHLRLRSMKHAAELDLQTLESPQIERGLSMAHTDLQWRPIYLMQSWISLIADALSVFSLLVFLIDLDWTIPVIGMLSHLPESYSDYIKSHKSAEETLRDDEEYLMGSYYCDILTEPHVNKEIKLFGLIDHFLDRFKVINRTIEERRIAEQKGDREPILHGLQLAGDAWAYFVFAKHAVSGRISIGEIALYTTALDRVTRISRTIAAQLSETRETTERMTAFFKFLDTESSIKSPVNGRKLAINEEGLEIEFRNVTFTYPDQIKPAINNLSFKMERSQSIVLVGSNGAGKTTIVKLITRLYDPQEGQIFVNGYDIREYDLKDLHSHIGVIFQDFVRYEGMIKENIGVGDIDRIDNVEAIQSAAEQSGASKVIEKLENGIDTELGVRYIVSNGQETKRKNNLSGGQWQKIALARAFMRSHARLLILDEPTAALDPQAEYEVYHHFNTLKAGKSALYISHRFSSVRFADKILVVENGKLVEEGSHHALMAKKGRYAELFTYQSQSYIIP